MSFLLENAALVAIAVVSGALLLWPLLRRGAGSTTLSPLEATQAINHRNAVVVDLRDEKEYALGSLAGARHLPEVELATRAAELARFKARPLIVVCGNGQRSTKALATFTAQGFTEVHALAGGIAAWTQAGLPLVKATKATAVKEPVRNRKQEQRQRQKALAASVVAPAAAAVADNGVALSANDPIVGGDIEPDSEPVIEPVTEPAATAAGGPIDHARVKEIS